MLPRKIFPSSCAVHLELAEREAPVRAFSAEELRASWLWTTDSTHTFRVRLLTISLTREPHFDAGCRHS